MVFDLFGSGQGLGTATPKPDTQAQVTSSTLYSLVAPFSKARLPCALQHRKPFRASFLVCFTRASISEFHRTDDDARILVERK